MINVPSVHSCLHSQMYTSSFLLVEVTHRQCSSILSSFQLKESWRQGHHRASSSPASIWFFSPPAHSPLISPSPLSPPPACRQESRCHPISLLSQSPPCSDLWWHLLSPAKSQTTTSHHLHTLRRLIVYADCWTPHLAGPLFGRATVCSHFLPHCFLSPSSAECVVQGVWVALVYLCEQGAVSASK